MHTRHQEEGTIGDVEPGRGEGGETVRAGRWMILPYPVVVYLEVYDMYTCVVLAPQLYARKR